MAMTDAKPTIRHRFLELTTANPYARWAHGNPKPKPQLEGVYRSQPRMLDEHSPGLAIEANVRMIRELAAQTDAKGKLLHPDIGLRCVVDGCLVEADVEQSAPVSSEHRDAMLRPDRDMVRFLRYADSQDRTTRTVHGYKLMAIVDLASTLPIVAKLFPAAVSEGEAALELIQWLFELWPNCPVEVLCGDALYDESKAVAEELVFTWAIQPVFAARSDYSRELKHRETMATPKCEHGLMKYRGAEGFPTPKDRGPNGRISEVITIDARARIRWECRKGHCAHVTTRPYDDARFYTWYPRAGDHPRAYLRSAIQARRNSVESVFSSIKQLGLTGTGSDRAKWAGDRATEWLILVGLMSMTARRLADSLGVYEEKQAEAIELGLADVSNSDAELVPEQIPEAAEAPETTDAD